MLKEALEWLQRTWWGIIITYIIVFATSYLVIWQFAEPLGIPDEVEKLPTFVSSRVFIHFLITVIVSAYITLVLDIGLRRMTWGKTNVNLIGAPKYQQLLKVMRHLSNMQEDISIEKWRIIYAVNENGDDFLREELTIIPTHCKRYFYYKGYSVPENASKNFIMTVSARNMLDNTPLDVIELSKNEHKIRYAIFLDHPDENNQPTPLSIECRRLGEWKELLDNGSMRGSLTVAHDTNDLRIEFIAPRGKKWKSLHRNPSIGTYEIGATDNFLSRIVWNIPKLNPRKLVYSLFLESE